MTKRLLLVMFLLGNPCLAWPDDAFDASERGGYATAFYLWNQKAAQGDAEAQYNLGLMYDKGEGVPEDDAEAVRWYQKAAAQGNARGIT